MSRYEIVQHALWPQATMELVDAVVIGGVRFERKRECSMALEFEGMPCNDYRCSACGKVHNAPRINSYCPRCGAKVTGA